MAEELPHNDSRVGLDCWICKAPLRGGDKIGWLPVYMWDAPHPVAAAFSMAPHVFERERPYGLFVHEGCITQSHVRVRLRHVCTNGNLPPIQEPQPNPWPVHVARKPILYRAVRRVYRSAHVLLFGH